MCGSMAEKNTKKNKQKLEALEKALRTKLHNPEIYGTADEFEGFDETYSGLWLSGEQGNEIEEDISAFNYWADSLAPSMYQGGIHNEIHRWLEEHGAWAEWHDAGTVMIYLDEEA